MLKKTRDTSSWENCLSHGFELCKDQRGCSLSFFFLYYDSVDLYRVKEKYTLGTLSMLNYFIPQHPVHKEILLLKASHIMFRY